MIHQRSEFTNTDIEIRIIALSLRLVDWLLYQQRFGCNMMTAEKLHNISQRIIGY